ncbi:hypothetical protein BJ508DRAFT_311513 [Ascobolus immersus RN42]|uniref:Uncharacterized protein n=1 Tax=Ascobolus immersus RN42 TaxID=1160509 RepID=A0A3N4HU20_ASCIM|nr:hypothetical protein BJ508DRAFT_311513 [Ascobolus immersus RN42]
MKLSWLIFTSLSFFSLGHATAHAPGKKEILTKSVEVAHYPVYFPPHVPVPTLFLSHSAKAIKEEEAQKAAKKQAMLEAEQARFYTVFFNNETEVSAKDPNAASPPPLSVSIQFLTSQIDDFAIPYDSIENGTDTYGNLHTDVRLPGPDLFRFTDLWKLPIVKDVFYDGCLVYTDFVGPMIPDYACVDKAYEMGIDWLVTFYLKDMGEWGRHLPLRDTWGPREGGYVQG